MANQFVAAAALCHKVHTTSVIVRDLLLSKEPSQIGSLSRRFPAIGILSCMPQKAIRFKYKYCFASYEFVHKHSHPTDVRVRSLQKGPNATGRFKFCYLRHELNFSCSHSWSHLLGQGCGCQTHRAVLVRTGSWNSWLVFKDS